jgi:hypothetical protein
MVQDVGKRLFRHNVRFPDLIWPGRNLFPHRRGPLNGRSKHFLIRGVQTQEQSTGKRA